MSELCPLRAVKAALARKNMPFTGPGIRVKMEGGGRGRPWNWAPDPRRQTSDALCFENLHIQEPLYSTAFADLNEEALICSGKRIKVRVVSTRSPLFWGGRQTFVSRNKVRTRQIESAAGSAL